MQTSWVSISGLSVAFLVAACSSDGTGPANGTAGATNGTAGAQSGTAGAQTGMAGAQTGTAGAPAGTAGAPSTAGANGTAGSGNTAGTGNTAGSTSIALPKLVTSAANAYWKTDGMLTDVTSGTPDVTVNDTAVAQTWDGFGGAFNELGWKYLMLLSETDRNAALKLLFADDGARFTLGRIPIGASDYAIARYTLNETANDTAMANFSIAQDKMYLIPYVKAAQAIRPDIHFWGSPWTPPTWMKMGEFQPGNMVSPFDGGTMKSDDATLGAHAQYFVKFVQEYGKEGIKIETVAPQNEPNFGQNYPSCLWGTDTFVKFVGKFLGPTLKAASPETKIMLGTMSNGDKDPAIVTAVLADATAKSFVSSIGLQWGMLGKEAAAKASKLPMWQTEHKCGNYPWMSATYKPTAPNDMAYGVESWGLLRDWIKAGVTAYSAWNMVLDTVGKGNDTTRDWAQNALLTVDTSSKKLNITPTYYVFRHLAQYVEPGAKVVGTTGGDALAFKNPDGKLVTVLYNSGAAKTAIVAMGGKMVSFAMPAAGWATVASQ
ncbi:MAG TPA: glycoside hydrolase family 30 beta sandwich domain-containing protein [Polyangiaceae bacterium]|nr:glycoside hydrolase family 30 beta sandwich domain-containing protein [Polyangiaceae bacterium]